MRKLLLYGIGGIVALGVLAFVLVAALSGRPLPIAPDLPPDASSRTASSPPAFVVPPPAPAGSTDPLVPRLVRPGVQAPLAPGASAPPPVLEVQTLRRPIGALMAPLGDSLSHCFDEDEQAHFGLQPHTSLGDVNDTGSGATPVVMIQIEVLDSGLRVVDAPLAVRGTASDGLIACVQQSLRGKDFTRPAGIRLEPGQRVQMRYPLHSTKAVAAMDGSDPVTPPSGALRRNRGKTR